MSVWEFAMKMRRPADVVEVAVRQDDRQQIISVLTYMFGDRRRRLARVDADRPACPPARDHSRVLLERGLYE
jgi:glycine cleavage system regulatory protein